VEQDEMLEALLHGRLQSPELPSSDERLVDEESLFDDNETIVDEAQLIDKSVRDWIDSERAQRLPRREPKWPETVDELLGTSAANSLNKRVLPLDVTGNKAYNGYNITNFANIARAAAPVPDYTGQTTDDSFRLFQGMSGDDVKTLQRWLNKLGYTDGSGNPLAEDGEFGVKTLAAVNKFKDAFLPGGNLGENRGVVGPTTWDTLSKKVDHRQRKEAPGVEVATNKDDTDNTNLDDINPDKVYDMRPIIYSWGQGHKTVENAKKIVDFTFENGLPTDDLIFKDAINVLISPHELKTSTGSMKVNYYQSDTKITNYLGDPNVYYTNYTWFKNAQDAKDWVHFQMTSGPDEVFSFAISESSGALINAAMDVAKAAGKSIAIYFQIMTLAYNLNNALNQKAAMDQLDELYNLFTECGFTDFYIKSTTTLSSAGGITGQAMGFSSSKTTYELSFA
jgi:peptidoglycan hydrolase-like protein with peptidoglycan-binding domain